MGIEISWRSQIGTRTEDNRDCGGVGLRGDEALCIVLDGSTAGPDSGALAREISRALIDWYVATDEAITPETITGRLREIHAALSREHVRDSASYMIVYIRRQAPVLVLHAGDCLLGRREESGATTWLIQPHTLANACGDKPIPEIAGLAARHRLTRSFRARELMLPDAIEISAEDDGVLVVATDGFWGELDAAEQDRFLEGRDVPMSAEADDRSVLLIRRRAGGMDAAVYGHEEDESSNLYVRDAR